MVRNLVVVACKPEHVGCRFHSIEDHNYHIQKGHACPYCLIGSKPVPKCVIEEVCG